MQVGLRGVMPLKSYFSCVVLCVQMAKTRRKGVKEGGRKGGRRRKDGKKGGKEGLVRVTRIKLFRPLI